MSPTSVAVLAIGMSVDAFAAALGRGAAARRTGLGDAMRAGAVFGIVETATPVLGWSAGTLASSYVEAIDHWIAFALLLLVGGRMLLEATRHEAARQRTGRPGWALVGTAIGTSIDAMAVGVSLAFLHAEIWIVAGAIGLATFCMATGGMLAGRFIGERLGRVAEALGGIALILLGASILHAHLTA